jgi:CspA family cold shock protein
MGKGRDRSSRRRDFDNEEYTPSPALQHRPSQSMSHDAAAPAIGATVKWFNPEKGFGFVELADRSGDVFLHINALETAGHKTVAPGALLSVQVGQGAKGRQVSAVLEVGEGPLPPKHASRSERAPSRPRVVDTSAAITVSGTVKWFNTEKGFGFTVADDGLKDVFIHNSVVAKAGMPPLLEGQRVTMQVITSPKGREAVVINPTE